MPFSRRARSTAARTPSRSSKKSPRNSAKASAGIAASSFARQRRRYPIARAKRPRVSYHVGCSMEQILSNERCRLKIWVVALWISLVVLSISLFALSALAQVAPFAFPGNKPADLPRAWKPLVGEHGPAQASFVVLEKSANLLPHKNDATETSLLPPPTGKFTLRNPPRPPCPVCFCRRVRGPL